jgi:hypothetical protein
MDTCLPEPVGRRAAELMGAKFHAIAPDPRSGSAQHLDHVWPLRDPEVFVERVISTLNSIQR